MELSVPFLAFSLSRYRVGETFQRSFEIEAFVFAVEDFQLSLMDFPKIMSTRSCNYGCQSRFAQCSCYVLRFFLLISKVINTMGSIKTVFCQTTKLFPGHFCIT